MLNPHPHPHQLKTAQWENIMNTSNSYSNICLRVLSDLSSVLQWWSGSGSLGRRLLYKGRIGVSCRDWKFTWQCLFLPGIEVWHIIFDLVTSPKAAMDEIDGSFFDHIDGLLDFPTEDIDSLFPATGKSESVLPSIWSAQAESLPGSDSVFSGASSCDLSAELSIPYEDIVQLEWLSTFVEDSFSGGSLDMTAATEPKNDRTFHTSSPVSVLESSSSSSSSSSCSGEKTAVIPGKCGRARSKRPRPASYSPRPAVIHLVSPLPQCSVLENDHQGLVPMKIPCESSESFAESYNPVIDILKEAVAVEPKKKKKIKLTLPPKAMTEEVEVEDRWTTQAPIRKCLHCHITKTPQWRAGPLGPKTLCNACGVRYKSGRLFPEYRPAASPTFVLSLHSNSHKKVLDMRSKTGEKSTLGTPRGGIGELIPNTGVVQMDYM